MFKTVSPSKNGSFISPSMEPYKIPKLTDKAINFFPNNPSCSKVKMKSLSKLKHREDSVLSQLQKDREKRRAEIRRLEILNDSSLKVEKDIRERAKIESQKVCF